VPSTAAWRRTRFGRVATPGEAQQAVIIVRHEEQILLCGMMKGYPPLNEDGTKRARGFPERLGAAGIKAIYTSHGSRCDPGALVFGRARS
jgi:broad specificity phosphatase PhoE